MKKLIIALMAALHIGCATTVTTTTAPDGTVTRKEETVPAIKDDTKAFAFGLLSAFSPRPIAAQAPAVKPKPKKAKKVEASK